MLSVQFHYSNDRLNVFSQVVRILEGSSVFRDAEKIILFNGECDYDKFKQVKLEYPFCRMDFWRKGQEVSSYDKILYLDSDRIFPYELFDEFILDLDTYDFVFPKQHCMLKYNVSDNFLTNLITDTSFFEFYKNEVFDLGEDRTSNIDLAVGRRNPMSGCLAYHKNESLPIEGYNGWGFSDMLWFRHAKDRRYKELDSFDIHLHHNYDKTRQYQLMNSLMNGVKFGQVDERMMGLAKRVGIYKIEGFDKWII